MFISVEVQKYFQQNLFTVALHQHLRPKHPQSVWRKCQKELVNYHIFICVYIPTFMELGLYYFTWMSSYTIFLLLLFF